MHEGQRVKGFARAWRTACREAGVPGRLIHDFRRSAARNMIARGVDQTTAMARTGHKTDSMFRRYQIVDQTDHIRAADLLAQAMSNGKPSPVAIVKPVTNAPGG